MLSDLVKIKDSSFSFLDLCTFYGKFIVLKLGIPIVLFIHLSNLFEFAAGLYDAQLLSINGGTELLLYGGHQPKGLSNEIWKFTISTKTWELVAKMYKNRAEHVVFPISSFNC